MTLFTRIGATLWNWEPWLALDDGPRNLWLALYTTAEAKRIIPGLWHGSINQMAEAAHRPFNETWSNLDKLLDAEMVEFDQKNRVLRMTMLPDAGEYPASPTILSSWWSKFLLVPACLVRDAHVGVIRWILDTGAKLVKKNRSGRPTAAHEEVWADTFGQIPAVAARRRGIRRLLDQANDTSTETQPSLFGALPVASPKIIDTVSIPSPTPLEALGLTALPKELENNVSAPLDTVSRRYGEGDGVGALASPLSFPDPGPSSVETAIGSAPAPTPARPALALVPLFSPAALVAAICVGLDTNGPRVAQVAPEALHASLCTTIRVLDERGWGESDLVAAGKWLGSTYGASALRAAALGCPPSEVVAVWACNPGPLVAAIQQQTQRDRNANARSAFLHELTSTGTGPPGG
jgi:hypothetical protein